MVGYCAGAEGAVMWEHPLPTEQQRSEQSRASGQPSRDEVRSPRLTVQAKLHVGAVDDPLEREADDVASRVVAALAAGGGRPVGAATDGGRLRRMSRSSADGESATLTAGGSRIRRSAHSGEAATSVADPVTPAAGGSRIRRSAHGGEAATSAIGPRVRRSPAAASGPETIRRYFVHTPAKGRVEGEQFQAQEKAADAASFVDPATKKTTVKTPDAKRPPLRVSDDGRIAVEDSDLKSRQAKVFYAEPSVVKESNARLLETGSKYQLFMKQASAVSVPSKDGKPLHALARVLPRNVQSFDEATQSYTDEGMTMEVQATCDEVAQAIVHTGNIGDFPVLKKSITTAVGFGELNVAKYLLARAKKATPDEAVTAASNALQLGPEHDADRQRRTAEKLSAPDPKAEEDAKFLRDNNIVQTDEEKAKIAKQRQDRLAGEVKADMEKDLKVGIADAYGRMLVKQPRLAAQLSAELGVNTHASPAVGQAFGSIQMQAKDKRDWRTGKQRTVEDGGSWGSHYGAVVAKSGGDSVTLENYARNRENVGIADATSAMYYFQMYGTEKGQTWHETWANSDRRVVNPLTQVMGQSHEEIWTKQLAGLPKLASIGDDAAYGAILAGHQQAVRDAPTREAAMDVYRSGLLGLVHRRFQRYAAAAFDIAVEAGLAHFTDPFPLSYGPVTSKVDEWIARGGPPRPKGFKGLVSRPEDSWAVRAEALRRLRGAIDDVRQYYSDRFPSDALDTVDRAAPSARLGAGAKKALKPKQAAALDAKVKDYFLATRDDVAKYDAVRERGAHYAGEEVDASNNPMITEGRTQVAKLRNQGMTDDAIRSAIKGLFPSYSDTEIDTYFLATATAPRVAYLDSTNRTDYQLTISGSKIKQQGADFDTSAMFSSGAGAGYSIFVMSPRGEIFANEHKPGLFHHSSFLAGLPTAAAGELQVKNGKLQKVTNKSGHYHPGAAETYQVLKELKSQGLPLSNFGLTVKGIPTEEQGAKFNGEYPKARAFADKYEAG